MDTDNTTVKPKVIKPPVASVGVLGWIKNNLFNSFGNSLLTLLMIYLLWHIVPPLIQWAFIDSKWMSTSAECHEAGGACWSVIPSNFRFIIFGFFPYDMQWRPLTAMILLFALLVY